MEGVLTLLRVSTSTTIGAWGLILPISSSVVSFGLALPYSEVLLLLRLPRPPVVLSARLGLLWCPPWPKSSAAEAASMAVAAALAVPATLAVPAALAAATVEVLTAATAARWRTSGCLFIFSCLFTFSCLRGQQGREEAEAARARDLSVDGQQARVAAAK